MKYSSSTRFEDMETDIGRRFPKHIVVFVYLTVSSWIQTVLQSNLAEPFEDILVTGALGTKNQAYQSVSRCFHLIYVPEIDILNSFTTTG